MTQEDCYFYYYSSCNKGENCLFRHCEAALGVETVCPSWKAGCCFRKNCMYRHMELIKNRSHIPCYWENQPIGCQKPHCVFLHTKPRTNLEVINDVTFNLCGETVDMPVEVVETPSNEQSSKVSSCEEVSPIASPMVEPVVFNLNEEESDNDSLPSTPAKLYFGRKVGSVYKNNVTRSTLELGGSNGDLGIKSLQQIREERARKRTYKETENLDQNFNPDENVRHVILRTEPKILMNSEYEERPLSKRLRIFPKKSGEIKILTLAEIKQRKCLEKEMALPEESSQLEEDNVLDVSEMQPPEGQILKMEDMIATSNEQRGLLPLSNISKSSKDIVGIRALTLEEIHQAGKHPGAEENTDVLACLPKKPRIIKNKVTFDAPPNRQLRTWRGQKNIKSSLPFNQKSFNKDHLEAKRDINIVENQVFDSQFIKNSNKTDSPLKKERTNTVSTIDESTNLLSRDALNKTFHDEVQSVKRDEFVLYTSTPTTLVRNDEQKTHKVSSQSSFSSLIEDDLDYLLLEEDGCANMDIDTIADSDDDVLLEIDAVINS